MLAVVVLLLAFLKTRGTYARRRGSDGDIAAAQSTSLQTSVADI